MKKIAILIPVHNKLSYTKKCIEMLDGLISGKDFKNIELFTVVIDDGSIDGTGEWLRKNAPEVICLEGDGNLWWSGGINVGARYVYGNQLADYLLLWNNDIQPADDYFYQLDSIVPQVSDNTIIGSKIYCLNPPNMVWSFGGIFNPRNGRRYMIGHNKPDGAEYQKQNSVDWLPGMGTLIPVEAIQKVGLWDEKEFPQYHGDSDYTYRAKISGYELIVHPQLKIWNDNSNSELLHRGKLDQLFLMLSDKRSNLNLGKNLLFYKRYSSSFLAYWPLFITYFRLFGGFFKWKVLSVFGIKKT